MSRAVVVLPLRPVFHLVEDEITATTATTVCGRVITGVSRKWEDFSFGKGAAWLTTEEAVQQRRLIGCRLCKLCVAKAEGTS